MVGRNEDSEMSTMRETVKLIIEIVCKCQTVDEVLEALNRWLRDN